MKTRNVQKRIAHSAIQEECVRNIIKMGKHCKDNRSGKNVLIGLVETANRDDNCNMRHDEQNRINSPKKEQPKPKENE